MPEKIIELNRIEEDTKEVDALQKRLRLYFRDKLYVPLMRELGVSSRTLQNAKPDPLVDALFTGRITFNKGVFSGKFNAEISKALKDLGAKWDRKSSTYKIRFGELPVDVKSVIGSSESKFKEKLSKIDLKLKEILPEEFAASFKCEDLFDKALWKADKSFQKNVKNITVAPQLSDSQRGRIADDWQNNMELYIKDFTEKEIVQLRKQIQESVFAGNRYGSAVSAIQKSYGVSMDKAKFLARQETNLLTAKFKQTRYQDAGINEYKWVCVNRPHDKDPKNHIPGNVRYSHGILDQKIFRFDDPPVTSNPGEPVRKNNPLEDFNCIPGSGVITLDRPINKIFRRAYSGKLTSLVCSDGKVLNSTGNHPILTQRGWIASQLVNVGDYVFQSGLESFPGKKVNSKDVKASIEDIFNALSFCIEVRSNTLTESDFHGDGVKDQHVDVIDINRKLCLNGISKLFKVLIEFKLERSDSSDFVLRSITQKFNTFGFTSESTMSFFRELQSLMNTHITHADRISLGSIADANLIFSQPTPDHTSRDAVLLRNSKLTHPIFVILDSILNTMNFGLIDDFNSSVIESNAKSLFVDPSNQSQTTECSASGFISPLQIVDKSFSDFTGHVYNLETSNNWYYADDIIIHNCRCTARPIIRKKT